MSWPAKQDLLRLEGFEEPWELCVFNGKECMEDQTLADCGISRDNNTVTTVRKVLVAEGKTDSPPLFFHFFFTAVAFAILVLVFLTRRLY